MIVFDKPEPEYHADRGSLSSTGAKTLLRSPKQFRYELDHPRQISAGPLGTLTHALVLGTPITTTVKDWDGRTKEGKARAAEVAAQGLDVIDQSDWNLAHDMACAVLSHPHANRLFNDPGRSEVSVYAEDPLTGVQMRGRFDRWRDDDTIVDLKTTQDASPAGFARSVATFHYHLQDPWYCRLAEANGRPPDRFVFVAVEKTPPHLVGVYVLDDEAIRAGAILAQRALEVYRDCMEAEALFGASAWPEWGRPTEVEETLSLPRWAHTEVEDVAWL